MTKRPPEQSDDIILVVERDFEAPAELVFDAWLDPESAGQWLFATRAGAMEAVSIDPRVGGAFRFAERRGDQLADHFGTYLEIDRPRRLVFTFATSIEDPPTLVTIEIAARGAGCRLTLTHRFDRMWADYVDRTRSGWRTILRKLAASLPDSKLIVITRILAAPRPLVWTAWTRSEHIEQWWGPRGFATRVRELDFRVGGRWRYVMAGPDGTEYPVTGIFQEIDPIERIVTTDEFDEGYERTGPGELARGTVLTCELTDLGDQTMLSLQIMHPSGEARRQHEKMGVVEGWSSALDCLDEHLARLGRENRAG